MSETKQSNEVNKMNTITYEVREEVMSEPYEIDKETMFGTKYVQTDVVGYDWVKVTRDYDEELFTICKEEEKAGRCRNIEVQ